MCRELEDIKSVSNLVGNYENVKGIEGELNVLEDQIGCFTIKGLLFWDCRYGIITLDQVVSIFMKLLC